MNNRQNKKLNLCIILIMLIIGVLPLVTYIYFFPEGIYESYTWFAKQQKASDQFTHAKAVIFSIISAFMFINCLNVFLRLEKKEKRSFLLKVFPMIFYFTAIILSTLFSSDIQLSLHGGFDQMEPVMVLLGYSLLVPFVLLNLHDHEDLKPMHYAIVFASSVVTLIGVLQMIGIDIFTQPWMRYLIMNSNLRKTLPELTSSGAVYITFGNQNYVGSYVCIMLPLLLMVTLNSTNKWLKILSIVDVFGLITVLIGSGSKTGMIILVVAAFIGLVFVGKKFLKKWYMYVPAILILFAFLMYVNVKKNGYYFNAIKSIFASEKTEYDLTGIDTKGDCVRITYKNEEICFFVSHKNNTMKVEITENGQKRPMRQNTDDYSNIVTLKSGEELPFQVLYYSEDDIRLELKIAGTVFAFSYNSLTGDYKIQNPFGVLDEAIVMKNVIPGRESLASGRGYIWGITIPKLKDFFFIGSGPDTFPVAIGKEGIDYALRYNSGGYNSTFTRPHNYYLQMGINTGCVSLIANLLFFIFYLVDCCRLYFWKELNTDQKKAGFCCMLAVIGFLGCGIANDSMVTVTPLFWTALGIGTVINKWLMEDKNTIRSSKA